MSNTAIAKPAYFVIGAKAPNGQKVVRVREFFVVTKSDDKPAKWGTVLVTGKVIAAKSSAEAGEKGREFRDSQKEKGVKVARPAKAPAKKAPAKTAAKAPAKKAPAAKAPAKKATAKDRVNGRATKAVSPARKSPARKVTTRKVR